MGWFSSCIPDIAIVCIRPFYPINIGGGNTSGGGSADDDFAPDDYGFDRRANVIAPLGHAGILLMRGTVGAAETVCYEFGRYPGPRPTLFRNIRK